MTTGLSSRALRWTAAGVVVAAIGTAATIYFSSREAEPSNAQTQSGSGIQQGGTGNVIVGGDYIQQFKDEVHGRSREEAEKVADRFADVLPKAGEPAPFLVVDSPRHVWVRSSGTQDGYHVGAVYNESTVWADCTATTGFDPIQTDGFGAVWLRIRWHTDQPNDDIKSSQPSGSHRAWIYQGLTLPVGHNGKVPQCD